MKKFIIIALAVMFCCMPDASAQFSIGKKKINLSKAASAVSDLASAATLSDSDIAQVSKEYMKWMDENNPLAKEGSEYYTRIENLTKDLKEVNGMKLNFGVYEVVDVNAFACGDGSVRVCAGLMDIMTDEEVFAVIAHEIGHVVNKDSKDAMQNAYLRSAATNAIGAVSETVAALSKTQLGALADALAEGQFSQKQEYAADKYAFDFCVKHNVDSYAMYNSLNKLLGLSESSNMKSSKFRKLFSSHPDTQKRAQRVKEMADRLKK